VNPSDVNNKVVIHKNPHIIIALELKFQIFICRNLEEGANFCGKAKILVLALLSPAFVVA